MTWTTLRFVAPVIPLAVFCATACNREKPTGATGETKGSAAPLASAAPSPAGSDDPRAPPGGVSSPAAGRASGPVTFAAAASDNVGVAGNIPLAAAYAMVPLAIMAIYLYVAKRLGAFEAL